MNMEILVENTEIENGTNQKLIYKNLKTKIKS